jgi:hypothetical protein
LRFGKIELGLGRGGLDLGRGAGAIAIEVGAHAHGLIFLDRRGVRLARDANGLERVQNGTAFYFEFTCQIVDSYFAHPSLCRTCRFLLPLSCSYEPRSMGKSCSFYYG